MIMSQVVVFISPVNKDAPRFHCSPYHTTVSELMPVGGTVFKLVDLAYDPDVTGSIAGYMIQTTGPFVISGGSSLGVVTLSASLDYDLGATSYVVNVTAVDSGEPPKFNSTFLHITVSDEDDLSPAFSSDHHYIQLQEATSAIVNVSHSTFPELHAYDQDRGINTSVQYKLVKGAHVKGVVYFDIDITTGHVIPLLPLDRENIPSFLLTIQAYQVDNPLARNTRTLVVVSVDDLNDNQPILNPVQYHVTAQENLLQGSFVCRIVATDLDTGNNSVFHYVLDDPYGALTIDGATGVITILDKTVLDRETNGQITFVVYAEETATSERYASDNGSLVLTLADVNDNNPVCQPRDIVRYTFGNPVYANTTVAWVHATDTDEALNGKVRYILLHTIGWNSELIGVDGLSGRIYPLEEIDVIEDRLIVMIIAAEDQDPVVQHRRSVSCIVELFVAISSTSDVPHNVDHSTAGISTHHMGTDFTGDMETIADSTAGVMRSSTGRDVSEPGTKYSTTFASSTPITLSSRSHSNKSVTTTSQVPSSISQTQMPQITTTSGYYKNTETFSAYSETSTFSTSNTDIHNTTPSDVTIRVSSGTTKRDPTVGTTADNVSPHSSYGATTDSSECKDCVSTTETVHIDTSGHSLGDSTGELTPTPVTATQTICDHDSSKDMEMMTLVVSASILGALAVTLLAILTVVLVRLRREQRTSHCLVTPPLIIETIPNDSVLSFT